MSDRRSMTRAKFGDRRAAIGETVPVAPTMLCVGANTGRLLSVGSDSSGAPAKFRSNDDGWPRLREYAPSTATYVRSCRVRVVPSVARQASMGEKLRAKAYTAGLLSA